jgi:cyclic pyranopterin phosphate synthase
MADLQDQLGRSVRDLRISVTDRCNLRCPHCLPAEVYSESFQFLRRSRILRFEEITRVARLFAELGVTRLRLTGGEPLLRRGLPTLVRMLRDLPGVQEIAMTTNGMLLPRHADALAAAGLDRVTVSLDSLDPTTYATMTGGGKVEDALTGLEAGLAAGLRPVKVNAVIRRGMNESAVLALARRFHGTGVIVRYIEYMDVGTVNHWRVDDVVPAAEIRATLETAFPLEPLPGAHSGEVATRYRYRDGGGEVGIIASVTAPFCKGCTRIRLSSDGQLFTCLFAADGTDIRTPLRTGASDRSLRELLTAMWRERRDRYSEQRAASPRGCPRVEMYHIGG